MQSHPQIIQTNLTAKLIFTLLSHRLDDDECQHDLCFGL